MTHLPAALGRYVLFAARSTSPPLRRFVAADAEAGLVDVHLLPASDAAPALVTCRCELAHPCVAAVVDTGAAGEERYLVEEHVEGVSLARLVARGGLPADAFLYVLANLTSALAAAERLGAGHPVVAVRVPALEEIHVSWAGQLRVSSAALVTVIETAETLIDAPAPAGRVAVPWAARETARGLAALVPRLLDAAETGPAAAEARALADLLAAPAPAGGYAAWEERARAALRRAVAGPGGELLAGRLADLRAERAPEADDEEEALRRQGAAALAALPGASPVRGVAPWRPPITRLRYEPAPSARSPVRRTGLPSLPPLSSQAVGGMLPGTPYHLVRPLGIGGMGVVYEAEHVHLRRRVAIKVLRADLHRDARMLARFRQEARSAARIEHPGVVTIYDFGASSAGELFLVMELLQGQTLTARLDEGLPPLEEAVAVLRQLCQALGAAHRAGVVHRDLKPDNVMLLAQPEEATPLVKVLDFGIARFCEAAGGPRSGLTGAGRVIGTPEYMAPEQVLGDAIDHRADIYALGCVAYELLTGHLPVAGQGPLGMASAHLRSEPVPPRERAPERRIPEALERAVLRALAKSPAARFSSMAELDSALAKVLEPVEADPSMTPRAAAAQDGGPAPRDPAAPQDDGPARQEPAAPQDGDPAAPQDGGPAPRDGGPAPRDPAAPPGAQDRRSSTAGAARPASTPAVARPLAARGRRRPAARASFVWLALGLLVGLAGAGLWRWAQPGAGASGLPLAPPPTQGAASSRTPPARPAPPSPSEVSDTAPAASSPPASLPPAEVGGPEPAGRRRGAHRLRHRMSSGAARPGPAERHRK